YVFVVAYVGGADEPLHHHGAALKVLGPVFGLFLAVELFFATLGSALSAVHTLGPKFVFGFGTPEHIGKLFLTTYLFPFEVASLLLMVAAVGAVVLARRRRGLEGTTEGEERPFRVARPIFTGTMHETTGIRGGGGTTTQGASGAQTEPIGDLTGQQAGDGRREPAGAGDSRSKGGW
ncbi:MAG TPA: NADH-quinone oxidoreductase subunit J, partial [Solirubrobacteraceae bacterium]|nr:NADH-quinone oxidoreductase subunit J [Solirubrobacteraceae bacterium]